ncbi:8245_t:CDS:2 [Dentiscutata erythropus]|uniref:Sterol regulatory element-binding protein cleavage-activating protein n=1 Tax=Dentiscutata erythropus TaxID=1348616 RepID=A0A9N9CY41_9GLOM|nr:8245_t:CDS:2 [Dentiscutata erythropus]
MAVFTLSAQIQVGSKAAAQFFYRHAKFCASHQVLVIVLAILIVLPLCYPAFDAYYLNPVKDVSHAFFWEVPASRLQISEETFNEKLVGNQVQLSFRVEQVVIKTVDSEKHKGGAGVLEKDLLLWTLDLQERIANTFVTYPSQLSDAPLSSAKKYSLSDLCFKPINSYKCLIQSPLDYWSNDANRLSSDSSIIRTLLRTNKTSSFGVSIPLNSVFGNVVYEKKKVVSADSIILTYFLKYMDDYQNDQIIAIWEAIWQQVIQQVTDDIETNSYPGSNRIKSINMIKRGGLKHLSFRVGQNKSLESSAEWALLLLAYLIFFLYIILSSGRLNSVMSKFGLAFSTVAQVFASLIMSLSICSLFGVTLTLVSISWKLLPFVFILVGVENMFILSNAVTAIPTQLNVKERVAKGLEKVGYSITKTLIIWLLLLLICSATNIESIQEFCIFTSIAMIIDYMLQMSFFIATLSIDLERLELEYNMSNLFNNRVGEPVNDDKNDNPLSKTIIYGRRIGSSLLVLIFMVAVTNVYQSNIDLPPFKPTLSSLFNNFTIVIPTTRTNITFWETSKAVPSDKFWDIVNTYNEGQFAEILPIRHLTLNYYPVEHDMYVPSWQFIIKLFMRAFVWILKFIVFPATGIAFAISFLVGFLLPADLVIRAARLSKKSRNDVNKIILPASTPSGKSILCVTTPRVVTLRGHHSADVDLLCANLNGNIISTATDRHITSWNGKKGMQLQKLERYIRPCESCKGGSTGGMKNCISWPVRAMCMNEKSEFVAAGFEDGVVRIWDINLGQVIYILGDTAEDVEQVTSTANNHSIHSIKERVTCLQIIVPTSHNSMPTTPTCEHNYSYSTSKSISDQKMPAILLATYRNGYFREWDLVSGQITHTVATNQKGGISCLFVIDNGEDNNRDELRIFTGARDGSVKCWVRTVYDSDNESDDTNSDDNKQRKSMWKLFYTIPNESGNAITSIAAKVVKTQKDCLGIVVTGTADGEVRIYDYLTGKYITRLSYGIFEKEKRAKDREEQLLQKPTLFQQQNKSRNHSRKSYIINQKEFSDSEQDWSEEYDDDEYEFWDETDETEDCVSHQGAITNIIINPLKEESCLCGNTEETSGFSITTSSLDEKVYFWQLIRNFMDCTCMTFQLREPITDDYNSEDINGRPQEVTQWFGAMTKFLGRVSQPGGSAIVFLRESIIGVRRVKNSHTSMKRCHGAEGEWELWILDINYPHVIEQAEDVDNSENYDDVVEFKVKVVPLVNENDLITEEQKKEKDILYKRQDRENVEELKGFVRRRRDISKNCSLSPTYSSSNNLNQNHSQVHNHEEDNTQSKVMDFRQRGQRQRGSILHRVYPNNNIYDRRLSSFEEEDEMNEILPFSCIRQVVKVGEDGVAVAYGNFVKVVLFDELNDGDNDL